MRTFTLVGPYYGGVDGAELQACVGGPLQGRALEQVKAMIRQSPEDVRFDPDQPATVSMEGRDFVLTQPLAARH